MSLPIPHATLPYIQFCTHIYTPNAATNALLNATLQDPHLVTVEGPPVSFSPFTLVDCMALAHFSFNDFVAVAFPDLAKDLEIQI